MSGDDGVEGLAEGVRRVGEGPLAHKVARIAKNRKVCQQQGSEYIGRLIESKAVGWGDSYLFTKMRGKQIPPLTLLRYRPALVNPLTFRRPHSFQYLNQARRSFHYTQRFNHSSINMTVAELKHEEHYVVTGMAAIAGFSEN